MNPQSQIAGSIDDGFCQWRSPDVGQSLENSEIRVGNERNTKFVRKSPGKSREIFFQLMVIPMTRR